MYQPPDDVILSQMVHQLCETMNGRPEVSSEMKRVLHASLAHAIKTSEEHEKKATLSLIHGEGFSPTHSKRPALRLIQTPTIFRFPEPTAYTKTRTNAPAIRFVRSKKPATPKLTLKRRCPTPQPES